MAKQTVSIIGAGLSGLTLSRCLQQRGIPTIVYERTSTAARHNYGITLYASAYIPLLKTLNVSEKAFKSRVAVDEANGGAGSVRPISMGSVLGKLDEGEACFQANRGNLEDWLREGLDIRWDYTLQNIEPSSVPDGQPIARFSNGQEVQTSVVVGADGPHSALRNSLLPEIQLAVLPFVVFNGKRRIDRDLFEVALVPYLGESNVITFRKDDIRIKLSIDNYTTERISISWTYSRPSRGASDPLYKPERTLSGATKIPEKLFDELGSLLRPDLPQPFGTVLDEKEVRKDRLLHWLMRVILVPKDALRDIASGGIVLIGDAVHAEPIVGGNGANAAILDAVSLAEHIAKTQGSGLSSWYDSRYGEWEHDNMGAKANIETLHKSTNAKI
ncbi:hypothetical protein FB567DRAFT_452739 [Paraphoma chrysanthemicola]|uniref:FAD-binding domain-containing protein n=1 Tax=Paraphoma chrysanthemicola TaxID=798071 RepID=A0A8K0QY50_9PLEO|nr:hypothetical protein FB567DRAFT_452739 [Paraphoma chrysanthemicola]